MFSLIRCQMTWNRFSSQVQTNFRLSFSFRAKAAQAAQAAQAAVSWPKGSAISEMQFDLHFTWLLVLQWSSGTLNSCNGNKRFDTQPLTWPRWPIQTSCCLLVVAIAFILVKVCNSRNVRKHYSNTKPDYNALNPNHRLTNEPPIFSSWKSNQGSCYFP